MLSQRHIAITTSNFAQVSKFPLTMLSEHAITWTSNPYGRTLTETEVAALLQGCVGVIAGTEPLPRRVLETLPELRVISRCGTGMDAIDLDAAADLGILVCNTPDAPTQAVAELTLGLMLDVLRHVSCMDREIRAGTWRKHMGGLLQGTTVGIIGMGRIGSAVARLCLAFGADVAYCDPVARQDSKFPRLAMDDLLRRSRIVSLHCPPDPAAGAVPLLGRQEMDLLPQGALLLNLARGGLVDEDALAAMLRAGRLGGAALDVYVQEPYTGPLRDCPHTVLTAHCASYAREARREMEVTAVRNLIQALNNLSDIA